MGALVAEHGHSTYGGNSNIIADSNEAWVVIQFAGGQGLWAAERLNDDSIRPRDLVILALFPSRSRTHRIFSTRRISSLSQPLKAGTTMHREQLAHRYPHQVSGGQLQRAMTAMAMSCRPELIIFDEPTTALDVTTQVEVLAAIRKVVAEHNTAAIYITHDLAVVSQMADRVMVLRHGKEVEQARTREMLSSPSDAYTKSLWSVRQMHKPAEPRQDAVLEIRNIVATYGRGAIKVLDNVSVSVPRGRTLAIVGESGSGKSTLARVVTGLLRPSAGNILFNEVALPPVLKSRTREQLRQIQLVYQSATPRSIHVKEFAISLGGGWNCIRNGRARKRTPGRRASGHGRARLEVH